MRKTMLGLILAATAFSVCAKNVELPPGVTVRPGNMSGDYIDTFSREVRGATFAKLKLCLAQNVSNPAVTMTGGTDVPFSFNSSHRTQTSSIDGGDVFKFEDETAGIAIAVGTTDGGTTMMGMSRALIRFEVVAESKPDRSVLKFTNISRAETNTGSVTNQGFMPVGAWKGAKPLAVLETLQRLSDRLDSCLQ